MSIGLNNGKSREYKTITLIFKTLVGKTKITELIIGLLKSTSGPGTGMVAISGSKNNNHVLFDKVSNYSYGEEFYGDAHESLTKLFNEHIKPLL